MNQKNYKKEDFVKWFFELDKNSFKIVGKKGANLAEIYNKGFPVKPGFVITVNAFKYFLKNSQIDEKIDYLLNSINYDIEESIKENSKKIYNLILNSDFPRELEEEILESYNSLDVNLENVDRGSALDILKCSLEPPFVAVRSSSILEDSKEFSFAGQYESYLNIKGGENLIVSIKKCYASLFSVKSLLYRHLNSLNEKDFLMAVIVQQMVDSYKSGVVFSKNYSGFDENIIIESVWGLAEGITSGKINPDRYILSRDLEILKKEINDKKIAIVRNSAGNKKIVKLIEEKSKRQVLSDFEIKKVGNLAVNIEECFNKPQLIEFAIDNQEVFIVQAKDINVSSNIKSIQIDEQNIRNLIFGIPISPGFAKGKIKKINSLYDLRKISEKDIILVESLDIDIFLLNKKPSAIISKEGGSGSHIAVLLREMKIPCVSGVNDLIEGFVEKEIVLDGGIGILYPSISFTEERKKIAPIFTSSKSKIKLVLDGSDIDINKFNFPIGVGLLKIEKIILKSGKHPSYFLENSLLNEYFNIIFNGVKKISENFQEIWIRTLDLRSDECENLSWCEKIKEKNPLMGNHGIRYSLRNLDIFKTEISVIKEISKLGKSIGILIPNVVCIEEFLKVKEVLKEINFENCKVGLIIETPAAVQLIKDFCDKKVDMVFIDVEKLTEHILAVDMENKYVREIYNTQSKAVLYQIDYVLRVCKREGIKTNVYLSDSVDKETIKFIFERGADFFSVSPEKINEFSEYILQLEDKIIKGTDKEPRYYESKKIQESF